LNIALAGALLRTDKAVACFELAMGISSTFINYDGRAIGRVPFVNI
jgi:hypothetical protein